MRLKTKIKSLVMGYMAGEKKQLKQRKKARRARPATGPVIEYFHQVDDPYSLLAVQKLKTLQASYDVSFNIHLVNAPPVEHQGDSSRFKQWSLDDAKAVADDYGVQMPNAAMLADDVQVMAAKQQLLDVTDVSSFVDIATGQLSSLWLGKAVVAQVDIAKVNQSCADGDKLRAKLGHYLSATFYFEGEWYWGVDRLYSLEARLRQEGLAITGNDICVPRPCTEIPESLDGTNITLEYFPSLRSPYTAVGHQRVMDLVAATGVKLVLRPVMPMMMRGVPAPRVKQLYIMSDAGREAREAGVKFGNFVDPFGEPVKRAFALFPWAQREQKAEAYVAAYLKAAWADGIDIVSDIGLKQVVESVGLSWSEAQRVADNQEWQGVLEDNVQSLLGESLWGVPSFRVSGGLDENGKANSETYACWGQDRIWRVQAEIVRRASVSAISH